MDDGMPIHVGTKYLDQDYSLCVERQRDAALARVKELEKQLADVTAHRDRLIDSSIEAWSRVDDQS